MTEVPRRSVLYMPASNARALEKATTLPVDGLILDLEDAVGPDEKLTAREQACAAVASDRYGHREVTIRVNGTGTPWHDADLEAACAAGPDGIVVPKVGSAAEVRDLVDALDRHGAPDRTRLWAMVETPRAVLDAREIVGASDRLAVLVLGTNDLVKELGARSVPGRAPLLTALSLVVLAAREAGVAVLDGVYNDVRDVDLPDAYFGGIFVSNLLEHLPTPDAIADFLAQMRRATAPGGRIAVMGPGTGSAGSSGARTRAGGGPEWNGGDSGPRRLTTDRTPDCTALEAGGPRMRATPSSAFPLRYVPCPYSSSSLPLPGAAFVTPRTSFTFASISAITAGLSRRKSLAFSRPWPMRCGP